MEINSLLFQGVVANRINDIKILIKQGADVNSIHKIGDVELTSLYIAAQNGYTEIVKLLISEGAEVDARISSNGATALFIASINGHLDVMRLLLENKANTEIPVLEDKSEPHTPLYAAIHYKRTDHIKLLLEWGAKVYSEAYITPLLSSYQLEEYEIFNLLLEKYWKDLDLSHQNLVSVDESENFEVVVVRYNEDLSWLPKEFPNEKVTVYNKGEDDLFLPDNFNVVKIENIGYLGGTYLHHIINNYNNLASRVLFIQGYPYDTFVLLPLLRYKNDTTSSCSNIIAKCSPSIKLLDHHIFLREFDNSNLYQGFNYTNNNLLGFAHAYFGENLPEAVDTCLGSIFAVDSYKIRSRNIEFYESINRLMNQRFPIEDFYLERLWDLMFQSSAHNESFSKSYTPTSKEVYSILRSGYWAVNKFLFEASMKGDALVIKNLLVNGANPSAIHKIGEVEAFPLYMAAQNGHAEVVRLLLDAGAKVDAKLNTDGATALYIAALNGHSEIVDLLVRAGADANVEVGIHAYTPLYVAVHKRDYETTNLLLKAGAAIILEGNRLSPLNIAASNNDQVKELIFSYYWKIVESKAQEVSEQRDFEVVIVRYNEDVSWVAKEFPNEKVNIYNKGKDDLVLPTKNSREVRVPNVGYLGGTYLEHIIRNYENLAERTLFLQAYPYDHPLKTPLLKFKYESESGCKNIIAKCTSETDLEEENIRVREVKFGKFDHDKGVYNDFNLTEIDLIEFTQQHFEGEQIKKINMCIGAEFAVDRANILSRSKDFYERLQATLNYTTFPLEDFYFERLWDIIFHTLQAKDFAVSVLEKSPKTLYVAAQNGHLEIVEFILKVGADPNLKVNGIYQAELSKIASILKRLELPGNKSIYSLPNGLVFVMNDNDAVSAMYGIKEGIGHEPYIFEKMIRFMREGEHFIEVGANYGDYSLQMARILGNNARVFAFEPGQKVFKYLQINALLNDLPNLKVENLALLDQEMILEFNEVEDSSLGSYMGSGSFSHRVKSTTLDSYFEGNILPIGAIRLDAQGAECRVLKGASRIIDSSPNIKLFIEWEEKLIGWYDSVEIKQQCLASLESRGFIFIDLLNFNEECHYSNFLLPASYIISSDSIEFLAVREKALENILSGEVHSSNCNVTLNNLLFNAVLNRNAQMAKNYIKKGADVGYVKLDLGANSLHIATQNGDKEIVELLLDAGANIEAIASNGLTPLCIAAQVKQAEIAKLFIEHHANTECKFPSGANALYVSSYLGDTATAILLMKEGADIKLTVEGIDIVSRARSNNYPETAKLFEVGVEDFCRQTREEKLIEICGQDLNYKTILEN